MNTNEFSKQVSALPPEVIARMKQEAWSMALSVKYGNESMSLLFKLKPDALVVANNEDRRVLAEMASRIIAQMLIKLVAEKDYWHHVHMKNEPLDGGGWERFLATP